VLFPGRASVPLPMSAGVHMIVVCRIKMQLYFRLLHNTGEALSQRWKNRNQITGVLVFCIFVSQVAENKLKYLIGHYYFSQGGCVGAICLGC